MGPLASKVCETFTGNRGSHNDASLVVGNAMLVESGLTTMICWVHWTVSIANGAVCLQYGD